MIQTTQEKKETNPEHHDVGNGKRQCKPNLNTHGANQTKKSAKQDETTMFVNSVSVPQEQGATGHAKHGPHALTSHGRTGAMTRNRTTMMALYHSAKRR